MDGCYVHVAPHQVKPSCELLRWTSTLPHGVGWSGEPSRPSAPTPSAHRQLRPGTAGCPVHPHPAGSRIFTPETWIGKGDTKGPCWHTHLLLHSDPLVTKLDFDKEPIPGPKHYPPPNSFQEPLAQDSKIPDKEEVQVHSCAGAWLSMMIFHCGVTLHVWLLRFLSAGRSRLVRLLEQEKQRSPESRSERGRGGAPASCPGAHRPP